MEVKEEAKEEKFLRDEVMQFLNGPDLQDLELCFLEFNEWIVMQRRRFDLVLSDEPFHAITFLFNVSNGHFIHRLWNRTYTKGYVDTLKDLASLCWTVFYRTVPCLGLFGDLQNDDESSDDLYDTLQFPVQRKVSRKCLQVYKILDGHESAVTELLGIGLCSACLSAPKQEPGSDMEYGIKSEMDEDDDDNDDDEDYEDEKPLKRVKRRRKVKIKLTKNKKVLPAVKKEESDADGNLRNDYSSYISKQDGNTVYNCPKCERWFMSARAMNYHRTRQHHWGPFSCKYCDDFKAEYIYELYDHFGQNHSTMMLTCPCCNNASYVANDQDFVSHFKLCLKRKCRVERAMRNKPYDTKKIFKCELCTKSFASRTTLKGHMDWHKGLKPIKCTECDFATAFATSMYTHNKIHMREKGLEKTDNDIPLVFKCEPCGKSFNTLNYLKEHTRKVHENRPDQRVCEMCGLVFTSRTNLRRHKARAHPVDNSNQCKVCGYLAADNSGLQIHLRVHGEPNFICRFCAKALKSKQSLQAHERSHTGGNPFRCDFCTYACKSSSVLRKHIVLQHEKFENKMMLQQQPQHPLQQQQQSQQLQQQQPPQPSREILQPRDEEREALQREILQQQRELLHPRDILQHLTAPRDLLSQRDLMQ